MAVIKANINANPNIGLYGYVVDGKLLLGEKIRKNVQQEFEKTLAVTLHRVRIAGIDLPGVMLAGNKNTLLVPSTIFEKEEEQLKALDIHYTKIQTIITCLGNAIACNDKGAILSTEFSEEEVEQIQNALQVPCKQTDIAGLTTPGAVIVARNKKAIIHPHANPEEVKLVEETLQVSVEPATVNLGSPHLRAGLLINDKGMIVGDHSGGPEIVHLDEALGYSQLE